MPALLNLTAARFLLVNLCYRGYLRAHEPLGEQREDFAPSGNSDAPALCVLGSIVLGISALNCLASIIYYAVTPFSISGLDYTAQICLCAGNVLLGFSLMRRRHSLHAVIGGCIMTAVYLLNLIQFEHLLLPVTTCICFALMLVYSAAAVLRHAGKPVPYVLRIILVVLAAGAAIAPLVEMINVLNRMGYLRTLEILSYALNYAIDYFIVFISRLGLIRMLREPAVSDSGEPEPEKENAVLPADGAAQN